MNFHLENRGGTDVIVADGGGITPANVYEKALFARIAEIEKALRELHAQVWGECPSLLNEDSGGDGTLDLKIKELLGLSL